MYEEVSQLAAAGCRCKFVYVQKKSGQAHGRKLDPWSGKLRATGCWIRVIRKKYFTLYACPSLLLCCGQLVLVAVGDRTLCFAHWHHAAIPTPLISPHPRHWVLRSLLHPRRRCHHRWLTSEAAFPPKVSPILLENAVVFTHFWHYNKAILHLP